MEQRRGLVNKDYPHLHRASYETKDDLGNTWHIPIHGPNHDCTVCAREYRRLRARWYGRGRDLADDILSAITVIFTAVGFLQFVFWMLSR
jgi:hypothetical protein